ncbi:glycoside hydrolase family 31 protein [Mucilaginibacter terrae]|uniref:Alpha-D-xyloside xylohydrolase n=1 Tax=Mucilaginibacter terrae TaxID=1955052 RepID=A0ABU3GMZ7_9SPHI|nr:TIM-barrel domain-containing protein [Mucilaginibacter terrae]MDT3401160.1 alpha-D-xyloside xylohydrolase [Mucilaginibacter terrae]
MNVNAAFRYPAYALIHFLIFFIGAADLIAQPAFKSTQISNGLLLRSGDKTLKVEYLNPAMVRVRSVPGGELTSNSTNVCLPQPKNKVKLLFTRGSDLISVKSTQLEVRVKLATGSISYYNNKGIALLKEDQENPRSFERIELLKSTYNDAISKVDKTANGDQVQASITRKEKMGSAWHAKQHFTWQSGEGLFGLGSHQEDLMNLRGSRQYLYEHNLKKSMPVLMSDKGYGLLFDSGSAMIFRDEPEMHGMEMLAVNQVDYYFMYGPDFDQIIHQFRSLTGKVEIPPKFMFGYIQSKERYKDAHDLDSVLNRFRKNAIPLDVIVQDWQYWKGNLWGYKKFDETKYPEPEQMIRNIHSKNAHLMLSIWPQVAAEEEKEMSANKFVLGRKIYDAFDPAARKMYWDNYVNKNLFSKGVDCWWCDSSEPVEYDWTSKANDIANDPSARFQKNVQVMADLLGDLRVNLFALHHAMGIYENQRLTGSTKRVVNLTRASYPGMQRYGTMVWNGDTKATWSDFKSWIPGGLNYMATGSPYWTIDAGAFFVKPSKTWFSNGGFPKGTADNAYREFYVRNLQYACWLPIMRSHGTEFAREPWEFGQPGDVFYDAILKQIELRYKLLPYTYSIAAMVNKLDYTMTRSLLFDFRNDQRVKDIKDEFMFGNAFLICPVTDPQYFGNGQASLSDDKVKSRTVYLPEGTYWTDFYSGEKYKGGLNINSISPLDHIPVFVKAGAIVPLGLNQQFVGEKQDGPLEIRIYPGKDGKFTMYEDDGTTYGYQNGKSSSYDLVWDDFRRELFISKRRGAFDEMANERKMNVVIVEKGKGIGLAEVTGKQLIYKGKELRMSF